MGRRAGGGGGRGATRGGGGSSGMFARKPAPTRKAPPPAPRAPPPPAAAPAPAPAASAVPAPQQRSGGMMSGLMGTMAQGLAFGTGSAVAHQAVGAAARSFSSDGGAEAPAQQQHQGAVPQAHAAPEGGVCAANKKDLMQCLNDNNGDANSCQYYFDALKSCQENAQFA